MWDFVLHVARLIRVPGGLAVNLISGVALVLDAPPLLGLPSNVLAGGGVLLGTVALGWAVWEQRLALDDRARLAAALGEFQERLDEGTLTLAYINRWKRFPNEMTSAERNEAAKARADDYAEHVRVWNAACLATVGKYLEHKTWVMRKLPTYEAVSSTKIPLRVFYLRQEVQQKIDRLDGLQREIEAQSKRAAIS